MKKIVSELRTEHGNLVKELQDQKAKNSDKLVEELRQAAKVTKNILEDKIEPCLTLPLIINKRTDAFKSKQETIQGARRDAMDQFEVQFNTVQVEHLEKLDNIKSQFEDLCARKRDDLEQSAIAFERYMFVKNSRIEEMRNELIALYELSIRHDTIIQKVENGTYSHGIVTMRIPEKDKQTITLPTQNRFPELFKTLAKVKHLTTQTNKFTRAQEIYMKNIKAANQEKARKTATGKQEQKISSIELNKIDSTKASQEQLANYCRDLIQAQAALKKEEETLVNKLATIENLKTKAQNKTFDDLNQDRLTLKVELQVHVKENKALMTQAEKNKKTLERNQLKFARTNHTAFDD